MNAQTKKIVKPNNLKAFGSKYIKGPKQDNQNQKRLFDVLLKL